MSVESNVVLRLKDPSTGKTKDKRESHNIFLNYGRDWIAHLVSLDTSDVYRDDRIKHMAFGIGGTKQQVSAADIRDATKYNYQDYPNNWGAPPGTGDPSQTDTDPTVTALEWPVLIEASDYFDTIARPHTFPGTTGVVRFTCVIGTSQISYGARTTVPLSEVGLFTEGVDGTQDVPPIVGVGGSEKYMVAYNTFDTLSKTADFVLQVDWELRFS